MRQDAASSAERRAPGTGRAVDGETLSRTTPSSSSASATTRVVAPGSPSRCRTRASPSRWAKVTGSPGIEQRPERVGQRARLGLILQHLGHDFPLGDQIDQADPFDGAQPLEHEPGQRMHLVGDHHRHVRERGLERRGARLGERRIGRGEDRDRVAADDLSGPGSG